MKFLKKTAAVFFAVIFVLFSACSNKPEEKSPEPDKKTENVTEIKSETAFVSYTAQNGEIYEIPEYSSSPFVAINSNKPFFSEKEITSVSFENYGDMDSLGRCTAACASVGKDIMPTEKRGEIGQVKPSGWQTVKYDSVDGKYLYNRCHLIGFQLTGENANPNNLITGTRYLNVSGMLPFENMVADFVKETSFHVMYRVTPVFCEDEKVARGVVMEALSVEDKGEGIEFCVFCYNVQPDILIDYADGQSRESKSENKEKTDENSPKTYILNTNTKKFHLPECSSAISITENNKKTFTGDRKSLIDDGYSPCGICKP